MKSQKGTSTRLRKSSLADAIVDIIDDLRPYHPLTVRQVYYQLVSKLLIENADKEYRRVSKALVRLREDEKVRWEAIVDRTRRTSTKRGFQSVRDFLEGQLDRFADPMSYGRCYVQDQVVHVEVLTEKDALSSILESTAYWFCTRVSVVRGQASATFVESLSERCAEAHMRGQEPVILYLGDLDPSGIAIPKAIKRNLADRHGVDVRLVRVGLNPEQVSHFGLPTSPDALKEGDPNLRAWLEEYGPDQEAVELDALHPEQLKRILRDALSEVYDLANMDQQKQIEIEERKMLEELRAETMRFLQRRHPELFRATA